MAGSVSLSCDHHGASHLVSSESEESPLNPTGPQCDLTEAESETRAAAYLLLAGLLRTAPSEALLKELVRGGLLTLVERIGHPAAAVGIVLDPAEDVRWPTQAQAIAVEYARLFAVPGEHAVRPYESVYCDTVTIDNSTGCSAFFSGPSGVSEVTGLLHGPSTVAVRDVYRRAGFEVDPAFHDLPDHLAVELEFMGRLIERGALEQAGSFFAAHLGRWGMRCADDLARKASLGYFHAFAVSLGAFLRLERAQWLESSETLRGDREASG